MKSIFLKIAFSLMLCAALFFGIQNLRAEETAQVETNDEALNVPLALPPDAVPLNYETPLEEIEMYERMVDHIASGNAFINEPEIMECVPYETAMYNPTEYQGREICLPETPPTPAKLKPMITPSEDVCERACNFILSCSNGYSADVPRQCRVSCAGLELGDEQTLLHYLASDSCEDFAGRWAKKRFPAMR